LLGRVAALVTGLGAAGIVVAIYAGPMLLNLFYGPVYAERNDVLVLTMIAAAVSYLGLLSGYALTSVRYFRAQIPLLALVAAVSVVACWWLVPLMGLRGGAVAFGLSAVIQVIGAGFLLFHAVRLQPREPNINASLVSDDPILREPWPEHPTASGLANTVDG
jgi:O-antigen/teichoic acid export membrane protein